MCTYGSAISRAPLAVALFVISGFGRARKKIYVDNTCKLQVIYARRKEHTQRRGWERIFRKGGVAHFSSRKG
jgi:hypothetical protein